MKIKFSLSEFVITGTRIPLTIGDKILEYHISPMSNVREELDIPIYPSQRSGYRTVRWEKAHGRSGNSQHTFKGKGAVDWTCNDFDINKDELLRLIIEHTEYNRIAIYDSFLHCDYKSTNSGYRELYSSDWVLIETL